MASFPVNLIKSNGLFCCTITLNENKNGIIYFNESKATTNQLTGVTYPLLASTNVFVPHFFAGGSYSQRSEATSSIIEFCFNNSQVLTDDQVTKLHQYYKVKYNIPFS